MAQPLEPVSVDLDVPTVVRRLHNWFGMTPISDWVILEGQIDAVGPPVQARVKLVIQAPINSSAHGAIYETVLSISIDPETGQHTGLSEDAIRVGRIAHGLRVAAQRAETDDAVIRFLKSHESVRAQYEEGLPPAPGRLIYRSIESPGHSLLWPAPNH